MKLNIDATITFGFGIIGAVIICRENIPLSWGVLLLTFVAVAVVAQKNEKK